MVFEYGMSIGSLSTLFLALVSEFSEGWVRGLLFA
jgi:hypothetical protein